MIVRADRPLRTFIPYNEYKQTCPPLSYQGAEMHPSLQARRWRALFGLMEAFRVRDQATWSHARRVHDQAVAFAETLGLSTSEIHLVKMTALLHDIGKIAICQTVLNKEETLTPAEIHSLQQHVVLGERLVQPLLPNFDVLAGIRHHHERMDGRGYPDGLEGEDIPLIARVVSVVDVFDALTSSRPYRKHALSSFEATELLVAKSDGHLDQDLVQQFCRMLRSTAETIVDFP
jgi:putative two-component system response regulator